jgi:hypothetical protein
VNWKRNSLRAVSEEGTQLQHVEKLVLQYLRHEKQPFHKKNTGMLTAYLKEY